MAMDWIRVGVREEYIRSLFKEDTWSMLLEKYPEVKEVSIIGENGSWEPTVEGVSKDDRIEIYIHLHPERLRKLKEKDSMKLVKQIYRFLEKNLTSSILIEVKMETGYIGEMSGVLFRKDLQKPIHFWYHMGIRGFKDRVVFNCWTD